MSSLGNSDNHTLLEEHPTALCPMKYASHDLINYNSSVLYMSSVNQTDVDALSNQNSFTILIFLILSTCSVTYGIIGRSLWSWGIILFGFILGCIVAGTIMPSAYFDTHCYESTVFISIIGVTIGLATNLATIYITFLKMVFAFFFPIWSIFDALPSSVLVDMKPTLLQRSVFPQWVTSVGVSILASIYFRKNTNATLFSSAAIGAWFFSISIVMILEISKFDLVLNRENWVSPVIFLASFITFGAIQYLLKRRRSQKMIDDIISG